MVTRIIAGAAVALLLLTSASFAGGISSGGKTTAKHHKAKASAKTSKNNAPAAPAAPPVRHTAYNLGGMHFQDLSYTDANGTMHIWLENLGAGVGGADFDNVSLYINMTDFGYGGGAAQQLAADLNPPAGAQAAVARGHYEHDANGSHWVDDSGADVPAPGPPTPGKWVDQFGREMSHEE